MTFMAGRAVKDAAELALQRLATTGEPFATVQYRPPRTTPLDENGQCEPHYCYGYVAQAVEVEVDTATGSVRILKVVNVNDVGRAINRQQVEAQIEGCVAQAIGYVLSRGLPLPRRPHPDAELQHLSVADRARRPARDLSRHHGDARPAWAVRRARDVGDAARSVRRRGRGRDPRRDRRVAFRFALHARAGARGASRA